jgi:hypothetical protein
MVPAATGLLGVTAPHSAAAPPAAGLSPMPGCILAPSTHPAARLAAYNHLQQQQQQQQQTCQQLPVMRVQPG